MTALATCAIDEARSHPPLTDSYDYDAFGSLLNSTGTTPNVYKYRGEQWDPDLGLYYLRARYYNPLTGRFMSRDPNDGHKWDPKSLHKYLYAEGDPVDAVDPNGRGAFFEFVLVTYFAAQRVLIATPPVVIATCTTLDYGSLALNAIKLGDIAGSGELPTGPDFWEWLVDKAHEWCEQMYLPVL